MTAEPTRRVRAGESLGSGGLLRAQSLGAGVATTIGRLPNPV